MHYAGGDEETLGLRLGEFRVLSVNGPACRASHRRWHRPVRWDLWVQHLCSHFPNASLQLVYRRGRRRQRNRLSPWCSAVERLKAELWRQADGKVRPAVGSRSASMGAPKEWVAMFSGWSNRSAPSTSLVATSAVLVATALSACDGAEPVVDALPTGECLELACQAPRVCEVAGDHAACVCPQGYQDSASGCQDRDECSDGSHDCDEHASCENLEGSYSCECDAGYSGNGQSCAVSTDCGADLTICSADATCELAEGGMTCVCGPGYTGDGLVCEDIDGCAEQPCFDSVGCADVPAPGVGATCGECPDGYEGDGRDCAPSRAPTFRVGLRPVAIASADLNEDGSDDLFVVNNWSDTVTALFSDGSGGVRRVRLDVGEGPQAIVAGDFDEDGHLDLLISRSGPLSGDGGGIELWRGDGAGGVAAPTMFATSNDIISMVPGDLDGDGHLDVAGVDGVDFRTYYGAGDGTRLNASWDSLSIGAKPALALAHFDGDGVLDHAIVQSADDSVLVRSGSTPEAFTPLTRDVSGQPRDCVSGDFNLDGHTDLAVAHYGSSSTSILLGDGRRALRRQSAGRYRGRCRGHRCCRF